MPARPHTLGKTSASLTFARRCLFFLQRLPVGVESRCNCRAKAGNANATCQSEFARGYIVVQREKKPKDRDTVRASGPQGLATGSFLWTLGPWYLGAFCALTGGEVHRRSHRALGKQGGHGRREFLQAGCGEQGFFSQTKS